MNIEEAIDKLNKELEGKILSGPNVIFKDRRIEYETTEGKIIAYYEEADPRE